MFRNYFKTAVRNLLKYKGYTFINVAGLAVALASCLIILLYVVDELSYDRFHQNTSRIYRIATCMQGPSRPTEFFAATPIPLAEVLTSDVPGVEKAVRLKQYTLHVQSGEKQFIERLFTFADAQFFEIFSYPLAEGDAGSALLDPFSVVLTDAAARKYFGDESALGKTLTVEDSLQFRVTGVLARPAGKSHMQFDFLASFSSMEKAGLTGQFPWWSFNLYTYILCAENTEPDRLNELVRVAALPYVREDEIKNGIQPRYFLQPLPDIYLHSGLKFEFGKVGDILNVYVFSGAALLILLVACLNFINMSTARSMNRAKEVGIRKAIGAIRTQLMWQFYGETLLLSILALLVAMLLVRGVLPFFNDFMATDLTLAFSAAWYLIPAMLVLVVLVGLLAGSYPALLLSGISPTAMFGRFKNSGTSGVRLRNILAVFQFAATIALGFAALVVRDQISFMRQSKLGFDKEQIMILPLPRGIDFPDRFETIKSAFTSIAGVRAASASSSVPGQRLGQIVYYPEGAARNQTQAINTLTTDFDFIKTLGLELAAGRDFSKEFGTDAAQGFILNEAAVRNLGWGEPEDAIGKKMTWGWPGKEGRVVGVVKDFHQLSLQQPIEPVLMHIQPGWFKYLSLRLQAEQAHTTLGNIANMWQRLVPNRPFEYYFLDSDYDKQYRMEEQLGGLFRAFSGLALLIACLGLFGLAAFTAQQRLKEVGIRKVLGASVASLMGLISKDFMRLLFVAIVISAGPAFLLSERWLQRFPYRTSLSVSSFALVSLFVIVVALLTVAQQVLRAATSNPIKVLKTE